MLIADKQVLFFQHYDDWYLPSLRLLHKCTFSSRFVDRYRRLADRLFVAV